MLDQFVNLVDEAASSCKNVKDSFPGSDIIAIRCRNIDTKRLPILFAGHFFGSDLYSTGAALIDIDGGVDGLRLESDIYFYTEANSIGAGGRLSQFDCGLDISTIQVQQHRKVVYPTLIYTYIDYCPNKFISTHLQYLVAPNNSLSDFNTQPKFDMVAYLMQGLNDSQRRAVLYTDVVGVFGSANKERAHYDGILAQAYYASTASAFFYTVQYTIDESIFVDGKYLTVGMGMPFFTVKYQTVSPIAAQNEFGTRAECYQAICQWIMSSSLSGSNGFAMVATCAGNQITVIDQRAAMKFELNFKISSSEPENSIDWTHEGISAVVSQQAMTIDERPTLIKYRPYTATTVLEDLLSDVQDAKALFPQIVQELMSGREWGLWIDPRLLQKYSDARARGAAMSSPVGNIFTVFNDNVHGLQALWDTGCWFIAPQGDVNNMNAGANFVHFTGGQLLKNFYDPVTDKVMVKMASLHGIYARDWRLFASNLLDSPFVKNYLPATRKFNDPTKAKTHQEYMQRHIPCLAESNREARIITNRTEMCQLNASMEIAGVYLNEAKYAVQNLDGSYAIRTLQDGDTRPFTAKNVYELHIQDTSTGLQVGDTPTYLYTATFASGASITSTQQNPIITFVGDGQIALTVEQVVTAAGCQATSYIGSANDMFQQIVGCGDIDFAISGRIYKSDLYLITSATGWNTSIALTGGGSISLTGNSANTIAGAKTIIEAYLTTNNLGGSVEVDGNDMIVESPSVGFVSLATTPTATNFVRQWYIQIEDNTVYDENNTVSAVSLTYSCTDNSNSVTVETLAFNEPIATCSGSDWKVIATVLTSQGCQFEFLNIVENTGADANFQLTRV